MGLFRANDETNSVNEHNMVKNPSWREADQLAISTSMTEELTKGLPRNNSS